MEKKKKVDSMQRDNEKEKAEIWKNVPFSGKLYLKKFFFFTREAIAGRDKAQIMRYWLSKKFGFFSIDSGESFVDCMYRMT